MFQICLLSMMVCREFPSDEYKNEIRFRNVLILYADLKSFVYLPKNQKKHPNPSVSVRFFLTQHKCALTCSELFYLIIHSKTGTQSYSACGIVNR